MGGRIEVETTHNIGTRFVLYAPISLLDELNFGERRSPSFLARSGCLSNEIQQIVRVGLEDLRTIDGQEAVRVGDETIKIFSFHQLMGLTATTQDVKASSSSELSGCAMVSLSKPSRV